MIDLTEAYKAVYEDLSKCPLFMGEYDAKNGNKHFIYGIMTVMEAIADRVSDEAYNEYNKISLENLAKSVDIAKEK